MGEWVRVVYVRASVCACVLLCESPEKQSLSLRNLRTSVTHLDKTSLRKRASPPRPPPPARKLRASLMYINQALFVTLSIGGN